MLDRYKVHFIEIVIDKLIPAKGQDKENVFRPVCDSVNTALYHGTGLLPSWIRIPKKSAISANT